VQQIRATAVFVAKLSIGSVVHGTHNGELIGQCRELGKIFAEANAGQFGRSASVFAANSIGRIRLGIEGFMLRRTARLENENDSLGLFARPWISCLRLHPEQVIQTGAKQTQRSNLQELATTDGRVIALVATESMQDKFLPA
jgi:hypothetical protein